MHKLPVLNTEQTTFIFLQNNILSHALRKEHTLEVLFGMVLKEI